MWKIFVNNAIFPFKYTCLVNEIKAWWQRYSCSVHAPGWSLIYSLDAHHYEGITPTLLASKKQKKIYMSKQKYRLESRKMHSLLNQSEIQNI